MGKAVINTWEDGMVEKVFYEYNLKGKIFSYNPSSVRGTHGCTAWAVVRILGLINEDAIEAEVLKVGWCPTCGALEDVKIGDIIDIWPVEICVYERKLEDFYNIEGYMIE